MRVVPLSRGAVSSNAKLKTRFCQDFVAVPHSRSTKAVVFGRQSRLRLDWRLERRASVEQRTSLMRRVAGTPAFWRHLGPAQVAALLEEFSLEEEERSCGSCAERTLEKGCPISEAFFSEEGDSSQVHDGRSRQKLRLVQKEPQAGDLGADVFRRKRRPSCCAKLS